MSETGSTLPADELFADTIMSLPPYSVLPEHYEAVMESVDYDAWAGYVLELLGDRQGAGPVGDLGCGTGAIARRLRAAGLSVVGMDRSDGMVRRAAQRRKQEPWVVGDLLDLPFATGSLSGAVCLFDTLNYMLDPADFRRAISEVARTLVPGSPFLFDLNTAYALRNSWAGPEQIILSEEDRVVIWDAWMEDDDIGRLDLTFFLREPDGRFRRVVEVHRERAYPIRFVKKTLRTIGFESIQVYSHLTDRPPGSRTARVMISAVRSTSPNTLDTGP